jgi:hypothetical protein
VVATNHNRLPTWRPVVVAAGTPAIATLGTAVARKEDAVAVAPMVVVAARSRPSLAVPSLGTKGVAKSTSRKGIVLPHAGTSLTPSMSQMRRPSTLLPMGTELMAPGILIPGKQIT